MLLYLFTGFKFFDEQEKIILFILLSCLRKSMFLGGKRICAQINFNVVASGFQRNPITGSEGYADALHPGNAWSRFFCLDSIPGYRLLTI
jgi:hypothetical protein